MAAAYKDIHRDIAESCKKGNPKAQYELYRLYSKAMFNICYRMMNNREEAEDLLQEAFTDVFTKIGSFRSESTIGAWIKQIVVNKCINEIKRRKTDLLLVEDYQPFEKDDDGTEKNDEEVKLEVDKIRKAMEKLPDGYRIIFSLYLFEGYDHTEISQILEISESTSKSQYMRAKKKLLEMLKN